MNGGIDEWMNGLMVQWNNRPMDQCVNEQYVNGSINK